MTPGKRELKYVQRQKCGNKKAAIIFNVTVSLTLNYILLNNFACAQNERVAPGVNPNQYQPKPPVARQGKIAKQIH